MKIRDATLADFAELYQIGLSIPELRVTDDEFMSEDDFKWHMTNPNGVFLVAEDNGKLIGFACVNFKEYDKPVKDKYACFVYLAVLPQHRKTGVGTKLYEHVEKRAKELGATHMYGWMDANSNLIQEFMKVQGYKFGQACMWVDKKI